MLCIITSAEYADEFDYPVISFFTDEQRDFILENQGRIEDIDACFGTNESIDFGVDELVSLVENAKDVTDKERAVFAKFGIMKIPCIDLVEKILESIEGYEEEEDEEEDDD